MDVALCRSWLPLHKHLPSSYSSQSWGSVTHVTPCAPRGPLRAAVAITLLWGWRHNQMAKAAFPFLSLSATGQSCPDTHDSCCPVINHPNVVMLTESPFPLAHGSAVYPHRALLAGSSTPSGLD